MALKLSTGLRDALLDTGDFGAVMDGSRLKIYSGAAPATPGDAEGTELVDIGSDHADTNLHFLAAAVSGVLSKDANVWSGVAGASGTASYFRLVLAADTGASDPTALRLQGTIGTSGADLNMSSVSIVISATQTIDTFDLTMPAS